MKKEKKSRTPYITAYMKEKKDKISVLADKGTKERWRNAAQIENKSLNRFVIDIVESHIDGKNNE